MSKLNIYTRIKNKFGYRLIFLFAVFMLVITIFFTAFFVRYQGFIMTNDLIQWGQYVTDSLSYNSKIAVFSEDENLLNKLVQGIIQQPEILKVALYNANGETLIKRSKIKSEIIKEPHHVSREIYPDISRQLEIKSKELHMDQPGRIEFWSAVTSSSGYMTEESLYLNTPQPPNQNNIIGFAQVIVNKQGLNEKLSALWFKGAQIGILFFTVGTIFIFFFVKKITEPLNKLIEGVKALEKGGPVNEIPVLTQDEIGNLANSFNNTFNELSKREREKKELEEQLLHIQKMEAIGTLAGGIAHDFNNILLALFLNIEMAKEDSKGHSEVEYSLEQSLLGIKRAQKLVQQILTFSHKSKSDPQPISMRAVIEEAITMLKAIIPKSITIDCAFEDTCTIMADSTHIHQLIVNLCSNASHAMTDNGGTLTISLAKNKLTDRDAIALNLKEGFFSKLTVRDTGSGIEQKNLARIFDPFFTTKHPGEGTGLGLSVVHGIVKSYGGAITVKSELNKGSVFEVFFPLTDENFQFEGEINIADQSGTENILLVDDEEAILDSMQRVFQRLGYKISTASNGIQALKLFKKDPYLFDIIITDLSMPQMNGLDLAKNLIKIRPDIPIILCTGYNYIATPEEIFSAGIKKYLSKPVDKNDLISSVRSILNINR